MKKINPAKDFVVMAIPEQNSSIALPDNVTVNKEAFMVCVAVGPDVKRIVVGDRCITLKGTIVQVPLEGKNFFIAKEELIMGTVIEDVE